MKIKNYFLIIFTFIVFGCNNKSNSKDSIMNILLINKDTLYEKKIPLLTFDTSLSNIFDILVNNELSCKYYQKDITCFGIRAQKLGDDTMLFIHSINYYLIDFSDSFENPDENFHGFFKYKGFVFFCLNNCKKYTNLFHETMDSVRVKNSIFLYIKTESYIDDSRSRYSYIVENNKLIKDGEAVCAH
ncbi:MAG: hypothetical protein PHY85_01300 [Bacteroidales bacterium]|nr:hypothetical protein [Bacteroidales bacterium]